RDVAGVGGSPVTEGDGAAVVGLDGDVVGLDGAVPDHGLAQRGALDLGEVAVALVEGDVALAAVDDGAVAEHGVVGLDVGGVAVAEGDRTDLRVLDDLVPVTDHRVGHVAGHRAADVTGGDGRIGQVAAHLDGAVAGVALGVVAGGHGTVTRHDVVVEVLVDVAEGGDVLVDRVVDGGVPVVDRRVVVVLELLVRDVQDVRVVVDRLDGALQAAFGQATATARRRGRREGHVAAAGEVRRTALGRTAGVALDGAEDPRH